MSWLHFASVQFWNLSGAESVHMHSDVLLVLFPGSCTMQHRQACGPFILFYFFFLSGKSPAGPMCGITAQDPSRAGSEKRKQLSDNKLLFCDQTIVFLRSGWGSWECVKNDTQIPTCPCIYIYVSLWSHTCTDGISKSHVEPLLASGSKPAIFYTSECQIIQCTQSQNQEKQTDYPAIDKHSRSSPQ